MNFSIFMIKDTSTVAAESIFLLERKHEFQKKRAGSKGWAGLHRKMARSVKGSKQLGNRL